MSKPNKCAECKSKKDLYLEDELGEIICKPCGVSFGWRERDLDMGNVYDRLEAYELFEAK